MKRLFLAVALLLFPAVFLCAAQNVSAQTIDKNIKTVVLAKDQIINSDYVVSGSSVNIAGTVNGDAYVAGGTVVVEGTINGDLLAIGGNITIKGNITGNARVAGGGIIVTGSIGRNLSVAGGSINLMDGAKIGGSITGAGGMFALYGDIGKDIRAAVGQMTLGDTVGGNIFTYTGQLSVSPSANIAGDIVYWSNQKIEVASGAAITGKISQNLLPKNKVSSRVESTKFVPMIATFATFGKIISFIASFIVGLLFVTFFPLYANKLVAATQKDYWKNVGIGLLAIIVAPIMIILLLLTLIGIPLAILAGMMFGFSLYASMIVASIVIGKWIVKYITKKEHVIWSLFVGLIAYEIVSLIPVLGWAFSAIFIAAGLGAILMERKRNYLQLREKKLI